jgi:hypothetical protein
MISMGLSFKNKKLSRIVYFQFYKLGNTSSVLRWDTIRNMKRINFVSNFYKLDGKCLQDAQRVKI